MKSALILSALLGACATTSSMALDREDSAGGSVRLDLVPHADATRTFPAVIAAHLPTADRLASSIRYELGHSASVDVKLCVAGGEVESIAITRSSSFAAFDESVVADAKRWQFATTPGPVTLRTCEQATITYVPRA